MKRIAFFCFFLLFAKFFAIDFFAVSGESMEGAIRNKSVVLVNKLAYGIVNPLTNELIFSWKTPQKGDVVFFNLDGKTIVKRCVATQGTDLSCQNDDGFWLFFNGQKIPLSEPQYQRLKSSKTVPEGTILAIGDNYEKSFDSRNYGFVPTNCIWGKIL